MHHVHWQGLPYTVTEYFRSVTCKKGMSKFRTSFSICDAIYLDHWNQQELKCMKEDLDVAFQRKEDASVSDTIQRFAQTFHGGHKCSRKICTCMQAMDTLSGKNVAVKVMYRAELSALQQHAVLRGCAVHAKCCDAHTPHILPFYCILEVLPCMTAMHARTCMESMHAPFCSVFQVLNWLTENLRTLKVAF